MLKIITFEDDDYSGILDLRNRVLRIPLGMDISDDDLSDEPGCQFLAYYSNDGMMIGCLKIKKLDSKTVQIQQMAVMPKWQRKGVGSILLKEAESMVKTQGYESVIIEAREYAIPFYTNHGYQVTSESFEKITIPHRRMTKTI